jgi:hypothetical protein
MSTHSYNAAKYDAMAEELARPSSFKRLEPHFQKDNRYSPPKPIFNFAASRVCATCREEGCNEEGSLLVRRPFTPLHSALLAMKIQQH